MEKTQKTNRIHIALLGRVNSGKSSFLNLISGQDVSITSSIAGTTTDVVEKAQELQPIGPIIWMDTAGLGDETILGKQRMEKSLKALDKADCAILICEGSHIEQEEKVIIDECEQHKIPLIKIYNKADIFAPTQEGIAVNSLDKSSRSKVLEALKAELLQKLPQDLFKAPVFAGDLVKKQSTIILVIPIDEQAPIGRLLPVQVQAIRDLLDNNNIVITVKDTEYKETLQRLKNKPDLVISDSSVIKKIEQETPQDVLLTTFSILSARMKGDLQKFKDGAKYIKKLQDQDKVLIAETCTHHADKNDIGTVKIPRLLTQVTGKKLNISYVSGCDFPKDIENYKLVIQCGGCMSSRKEILTRIQKCENKGVAITNYGICLSELNGVLERVLEPFRLK